MKLKSYLSILLFSLLLAVPAQAGTITGSIVFDGKVPKMKELKMDADPICLTHHNEPVYSQMLVVGEGNTLGNVFVHVTQGYPKKDYPVPAEPAVLDQKGCLYSPHVLGVLVNQSIDVLNPDGTLHNVHAVTKVNKSFNVAMPKFRKKITRVFDKPEMGIKMKCDVHPWMGAYVHVMTHPFFATTGKDGNYSIENLPAGTYTIEAWHERLGTQTATVTLSDGGTGEANFTFTKPTKK